MGTQSARRKLLIFSHPKLTGRKKSERDREGGGEKVKKHVHKSGIWFYCFYWCFYFRFSVWKNTLLLIPGTSVLAER